MQSDRGDMKANSSGSAMSWREAMKKFGILLAGMSLLAGCSGDGATPENNQAAGEGNAAAAAATEKESTANAAASSTQANCAAATSSGSGPDVLGARLGMSPEDAFAALSCANPAFDMEYSTETSTPMPPMPDGSLPRTAVIASASGDVATIYFVGPTGREKAIVLMHDIVFPEGQAPAVQDLLASLQSKYGPSETIAGASSAVVRSISRAPGGKAFRADEPDFRRCTQILGWNSEGQFVNEGGCGLTINYRIDRRQDDPNLAQKLYLILSDQAAAIEATEQVRREIANLRSGANAATSATKPGAPVPKL
jgi:hypothetical protein